MSLVDVKGVNLVPGIIAAPYTNPYVIYTTMDAAGELCGSVIEISRTGNISKIGFRVGSRTVDDALKISLQTVDTATGRPTGTLIHADAYGVQASVTAYTIFWVSLQNPVAVTRGDIVAAVIEFNSYVAGNLQITKALGGSVRTSFPYNFQYTGSVWSLSAYMANFGFKYDDDVIESVNQSFPAAVNTNISWDTNDNPDRRGLRFSVPYNCRISGIFITVDLDANANIEIYDSDGVTLLETISIDSDLRGITTERPLERNFVTPIELTKDIFYRIILYPTTGTNIILFSLDVTDDGASEAMNAIDGGVNFHYTTCDGAPAAEGDWTQTATRRPLIGLMIDQLDDGLPYNVVTGAIVTGQDTVGTITGE